MQVANEREIKKGLFGRRGKITPGEYLDKPQSGLSLCPTLVPRQLDYAKLRPWGGVIPGVWAPLMGPHFREFIHASGARDCATHIDEARETSDPLPVGLPLLQHPDEAIGPMAALLLALGLGGGSPKERGQAVDAAIAAIQDGRLDGAFLGATMADLLFTGIIKPNRWQGTLKEIALVSSLHRQVVRAALVRAFTGDRREVPKNLAPILELLLELSLESREAVELEETRAYLETFKGSGKAAKAAKALLALKPGDPAPVRRAAAAIALEGRLDRAARWAESN